MKKNEYISLICPKCKSRLLSENIFHLSKKLECKDCDIEFTSKDGCFDFTFDNVNEKKYYEHKYSKDSISEKKLDFGDLKRFWFDPYFPEATYFLEEIEKHEIKNKTILLLGNGDSIKELYFLNLGARIIYSDLSINSVLNVKNEYNLNDYKKDITFHAIDAFNIPLNNNSIDMIYGYAFIHHIHNLDCFFKEIYRVLKPGGICLFLDNAYSPIMHFLKWKILQKVTNFIQKNYNTSPEDEKASLKGGYRREEIEQLIKKHGFSDLFFFRFGLIYWIFKRFPGVIFNWSKKLKNFQRNYIPFLFFIDSFLSNRSNIYNSNTIKLIFSFKK